MNTVDKVFNWLGFISHAEHTRRYEKLVKEYETKLRKAEAENSFPYISPYGGRRVGNTTRLADYYIQKLFTEGKVVVKDHWEGDHSYNSSEHRRLTKIILARLDIEHRCIKDNLKVSMNRFTIEIINNKICKR